MYIFHTFVANIQVIKQEKYTISVLRMIIALFTIRQDHLSMSIKMINWFKSLFKKKKPERWSQFNKYEKDAIIEDMWVRLIELEEDRTLLVNELGEMPTYCDKCEISKTKLCSKCGGSGI